MVNAARIIVIDDEETIVQTLTRVLQKGGYEVDTAKTGKEAIEKTSSNFYDVALIDIRLPDMEGTDLIPKAGPAFSKTIKIILTGLPSSDSQEKAFEQGVDAYLTKPTRPEELLSLIEEKLRRRNSRK